MKNSLIEEYKRIDGNIEFVKRYIQDGYGETEEIARMIATLKGKQLEDVIMEFRHSYRGFVERCDMNRYKHQINITDEEELAEYYALKEMGYPLPELNPNFRSICELYTELSRYPHVPIIKLTFAVIDTGDIEGLYNFAVATNGQTAQDIAEAYLDFAESSDFDVVKLFKYMCKFVQDVPHAPKYAFAECMLECNRYKEDPAAARYLEEMSMMVDNELSKRLMDKYYCVVNGDIENY